ncbi:MAG: TIGR01777 family protein [Anaerolineales bacterium]|nr:TIGR01777 family protein [Anaerolineales bacterium]
MIIHPYRQFGERADWGIITGTMLNILIAGGSGLLGSALRKSLQADGHNVFILSRRSDGMNVIKWDGLTSNGWGHRVNEMDAVIHLTGRSMTNYPWTTSRKKSFENSRILPGLALAQAIREADHRPSLFVQFSGINYYGLRGDLADESTPPGEDFPAQLAVKWENATKHLEELGIRRLVLRTSVVLARENPLMILMSLPMRMFVGGRIGSGKQAFPWIHIKDWVGAVRHLMADENARGIYNLIAPVQTSLEAFSKELAKTLHRPYWFPLPDFLMRNVLGEMGVMILDGRFSQPKRLLESGYEFQFPGPREALADLYG